MNIGRLSNRNASFASFPTLLRRYASGILSGQRNTLDLTWFRDRPDKNLLRNEAVNGGEDNQWASGPGVQGDYSPNNVYRGKIFDNDNLSPQGNVGRERNEAAKLERPGNPATTNGLSTSGNHIVERPTISRQADITQVDAAKAFAKPAVNSMPGPAVLTSKAPPLSSGPNQAMSVKQPNLIIRRRAVIDEPAETKVVGVGTSDRPASEEVRELTVTNDQVLDNEENKLTQQDVSEYKNEPVKKNDEKPSLVRPENRKDGVVPKVSGQSNQVAESPTEPTIKEKSSTRPNNIKNSFKNGDVKPVIRERSRDALGRFTSSTDSSAKKIDSENKNKNSQRLTLPKQSAISPEPGIPDGITGVINTRQPVVTQNRPPEIINGPKKRIAESGPINRSESESSTRFSPEMERISLKDESANKAEKASLEPRGRIKLNAGDLTLDQIPNHQQPKIEDGNKNVLPTQITFQTHNVEKQPPVRMSRLNHEAQAVKDILSESTSPSSANSSNRQTNISLSKLKDTDNKIVANVEQITQTKIEGNSPKFPGIKRVNSKSVNDNQDRQKPEHTEKPVPEKISQITDSTNVEQIIHTAAGGNSQKFPGIKRVIAKPDNDRLDKRRLEYHEKSGPKKISQVTAPEQTFLTDSKKTRDVSAFVSPADKLLPKMPLMGLKHNSFAAPSMSPPADIKSGIRKSDQTERGLERRFAPANEIPSTQKLKGNEAQQSQPDYNFPRNAPTKQPVSGLPSLSVAQRTVNESQKEAAIRAVSNNSNQSQAAPVNLELARMPVRRAVEEQAVEQLPEPEQKDEEPGRINIDAIAIGVYKILKRRLLYERERSLGIS
jgi:hypothetical protein